MMSELAVKQSNVKNRRKRKYTYIYIYVYLSDELSRILYENDLSFSSSSSSPIRAYHESSVSLEID